MFSIVNTVYCARLVDTPSAKMDLQVLAACIPNSRLYVGRPTQLKVVLPEANCICILFGKSGSLRLMGKGCNDLFSAYSAMLRVPKLFTQEVPSLRCQTMRVVGSLPTSHRSNDTLNLTHMHKALSQLHRCEYNFELFSALSLYTWSPVSVNIFASRKFVLCGIRDVAMAHVIVAELIALCATHDA